MKISYCISTLDRAELLDNTLYTFTKQKFPKEEFEIIIIDDNSGKEVRKVCENYGGKINLHYVRIEHEPGWRDCAIGLNMGLRRATGEIWAAAHPEIVISPLGLEVLYSAHFDKYPLIFQNFLNDKGHLCVLMSTLFLKENEFNLQDYKKYPYNELIEKYAPGVLNILENTRSSGNFVCMSMRREDWKDIGGFYEFRTWGGMDPDHQSRRVVHKVADVLVNLPDGICLHQYHPISQQAQEVTDGHRLLESRPYQEAPYTMPNLDEEHEAEFSHEITFEKYWHVK